MKSLLIAVAATCATLTGALAAPSDTVTQADLQALIQRLNKLEAENKAQAERIAQLEGAQAKPAATALAKTESAANMARPHDEGTTVSESGKVYTTASGSSYYLADATAGIFEPLSSNGIKVTPYGTLELDAVYNSRGTVGDFSTDWVANKATAKRQGHNTSLAMQNSIFGVKLETPETWNGWAVKGKVEFDIFGSNVNENDYGFHWRHAYLEAINEEKGWSILAGQTWHLWKIVTPSEIDGAWLEHTGHPYRRSPQFRVTKNFKGEKDNLEVRVGIVKGGPGMGGDRDYDGQENNSSSGWALIEGAVVYSHEAAWAKGHDWLVGIGGMYGRDRSHRWTGGNTFDGEYDEYDSKMLLVGASLPIVAGVLNDSESDSDALVLTGQFFAGDNLNGIQAGAGNSVAYHTANARGKTVQTMGGFLDLNYKFNYNWAFAIGYGFDNPDDDDVGSDKAGGCTGITYNDRAYLTAFYQVNDNLHFALEYARLTSDYYNQGTSPDQRVQFTTYFDF